MKKLLVAVIAVAAIMLADTKQAAAQNKFGYFDVETFLSIMPGIGKVDTLLQIYQQDSINADYVDLVNQLNYMDSTLKADSAKMPLSLYKQRQQEQAQRYYKFQNWQQYSQQAMQAKQQELLGPFYQKIGTAFRSVVAEGKYTYVFKSDILMQAPASDNLIPLVAKKLGIKVPVDQSGASFEDAEEPKPAATKPAPKPAVKKQ